MIRLLQWFNDMGVSDISEVPQYKNITKTEGSFSAAKSTVKSAVSTLDDLKKAIAAVDIPMKECAMNMVFGMGNEHADILLLGEAPGAEEDKLGLPFVGQSGQLLDKILAAVGLDRTKVYITNIVPWRPPGSGSAVFGAAARGPGRRTRSFHRYTWKRY